MERVRAMKQLPNIRTDNLKTNNLITNNPLTYSVPSAKMRSAVNYLKYSMKPLPPPYVSPLQQEVERKKDYWFDYDNPNQINSYADVITRTLTNMWGASTGKSTPQNTAKQLFEDSKELIYRGTIQPILEGDWGALLNNARVNWSETANLVDNVWKGFAIESGFLDLKLRGPGQGFERQKPFDAQAGVEGARKAFVDRVNYDFDTGSGLTDFVLEMLTPTNVALAVLSMGGSSMAQAGAKQVGESVSPKVIKSFGKHYKGNFDKAIMAMKMNVTTADMKALENIAKHATNMKLLSGVNKFKTAVNVVDKLGPTIGVQGTIGIPWKVIKATSKASAAHVRYVANGVDRILGGNGDPRLVKAFQASPELEEFLSNTSDAAKMIDSPEVIIGRADVLGSLAAKDSKELQKLFKDAHKGIGNKDLITQYIQMMYDETGHRTAWDIAENSVRREQISQLTKSLDEFAQKVSEGFFKTYDEYANFINQLSSEVFNEEAGITKTIKGFKSLETTIKNLEGLMHQSYSIDVYEEIYVVMEEVLSSGRQITKIQDTMSGLKTVEKLNITKELEELSNLLNVNRNNRGKALEQMVQADKVLEQYKQLGQVKEYIASIPKEIKRWEAMRSSEYARLRTKFDPTMFDNKIAELNKVLETYTPQRVYEIEQAVQAAVDQKSFAEKTLQDADDFINKIHPARMKNLQEKLTNFDVNAIPLDADGRAIGIELLDVQESINKLDMMRETLRQRQRDLPLNNYQNHTVDTFSKFLDETAVELQKGADLVNERVQRGDYKTITELGREYIESLTNTVDRLNLARLDALTVRDLDQQMQNLTKRFYGSSVATHLKNQVEELQTKTKDFVKDSFEESIKQTFTDDAGVNDTKFTTFFKDLETLVESFNDTIYRGMGELQGDSATFADVSFESANAVERINEMLNTLHAKYYTPSTVNPSAITHEIDAKIIEEIFDELTNLQYGIKRSIKNLELSDVFDVDSSLVTRGPAVKKITARRQTTEELLGFLRNEPLGTHREAIEFLKGTVESPQHKLLDDFKNILTNIENVQQTIGMTADIEVKWTKNVLDSYTMQVNALARNLYLLQGEDTVDGVASFSELLDAVEMGDYEAFPMVGTLEYITRSDTSELLTFRSILQKGVPEDIIEQAQKVMGEEWNPGTLNRTDLLKAVEGILEIQEHANTILDTLEGMVSVRQFYGSVEEEIAKGLDVNVAATFLDAVQRLYDNPASLINAVDEFKDPSLWRTEMNKLMHNMEMQLRGGLRYNVKAEAWRDRLFALHDAGRLPSEAIEEYRKLFPSNNMTHTAVADAYSEYLIHKHVLKNDLSKFKYVYMDIEAQGLNLSHSGIYQKSVLIPDHGVFKWYINQGVTESQLPAEDTVYHVIFNDPNRDIPTHQLKELFKRIYMPTTEKERLMGQQELIQFFGLEDSPIEIIFTKGEEELLRTSYEFIQTQKPPQGALRYRLHNGLDYDIPLLNNRMRETGLDPGKYYYGTRSIEDTKVQLEDMLKLKRLSTRDKQVVENLIMDHVIRRDSELSAASLRRGGVGGVDLSKGRKDTSKFLPTVDMEFRTAVSRLKDLFDPASNRTDIDPATKYFSQAGEMFQELDHALGGVNNSLRELDVLHNQLKRINLVVDAQDIAGGQRIVPEEWYKGLPTKFFTPDNKVGLKANHIGVDLMSHNMMDGVYVPTFAVKTLHKPNIVADFFDFGEAKVSPNMMEKMTNISGNIRKTMMHLRNPALIDNMDTKALNELHDLFTHELQRFIGAENFSPVIGNLNKGDTPLRSFATVYELFKIYNRTVQGMEPLINISNVPNKPRYQYDFIRKLLENEDYTEIIQAMTDPDGLFRRSINEYGDHAKLFFQEPPSGELGEVFKYIGQGARKQIDSLEALEEVQDKLKYSKVMKTIPVYRNMLDSFDTFQKVVDDTVAYIRYLEDAGVIQDVPANLDDVLYAKMRPLVEAYNTIPAFQKMQEVLSYTPEEMASYMRHQAKGIVIIGNKDLVSTEYFPRRNNFIGEMPDIINTSLEKPYAELLQNKTKYEALGINFKVSGDYTIMYFKSGDIEKIRNIPYTPIKHSYDLDPWIERIVDAGLLETNDEYAKQIYHSSQKDIINALNQMTESRKQLISLANDAGTSTMEFMDDIAMGQLINQVHGLVPDMLTLEDMKHLGMFEGNFFNHSVLGHIDTRRVFMPYSSFNPAKTMYNAADMLNRRLDAQVEYVNLIQIPEFKVSNLLKHGKMGKQDMVDYLKNAPHLTVAFLQDMTKGDVADFKLSKVIVDNVKDIDFAERVGAVIIDRQTYDTAYGVINNNRIKHPVVRFLDRTVFRAYKLGWLAWNYGVVARNIVDTSTKNIQTTKDAMIIPTMFETFKDYFRYKGMQKEIYDYAAKQRIHIDAAVNEFYEKFADKIKIKRDVFDLFTEYTKAGGEMGLVREALEYYGDATDKLYKRLGAEETGITSNEFRELTHMPDDIAEQWLKEKFPEDPGRIRRLLDAKYDRLTYKRAYEMHRLYDGKDITVDDFVNYLKSGRVQPEHQDAFTKLLDKTKGLKASDDLITKVFSNPVISMGMSANMMAEEILRISLFRYMKDFGYSTAEAIAEIATTHFNYDHKSMGQLYLEMLMPFSTFRFLNIEYWANQMVEHPKTLKTAITAWNVMTDAHERDIEDVILRRSLRYQINSGNIILDEESGLTAKINPSAMDAMEFFANPMSYITGGLHSAGQAAWNLFTATPFERETEEEFYLRKKRYATELIPFAGSHINRWRTSQNNGMSPVLGLLLSPLFNTTWTPAQGGAYATWNNFERGPYLSRYYPRRRYNYNRHPYQRRHYPKRYFPKQYRQYDPRFRRQFRNVRYGYKDWSGFSTFNRTYYGAYFKFRRGSAYPTKNYRSLNTAFSDVWRRSMSKKGNPKYRFLSFPTNKWTLKLKVGILRNLTSFNRWQ